MAKKEKKKKAAVPERQPEAPKPSALDKVREARAAAEPTGEATRKIAKAEKAAPLVEREYWVGTLPGCPRHRVDVMGTTFEAFTEKVNHPKGALKTQRERRRGQVIKLLDGKAKTLREQVLKRIISPPPRASIEMVGERRARQLHATGAFKPLGNFLFMVPLDDAVRQLGANWRDGEPAPMVEPVKEPV